VSIERIIGATRAGPARNGPEGAAMKPSLWSTRDGPGRSLALALPFFLAVVGLSSPAEGARPKRYALDVRINPDKRHLRVSGRVSV
jgi:hypothetical protein